MTEPKRKSISISFQPVPIPRRVPGFTLTAEQWRYAAMEPIHSGYADHMKRALNVPWKFVPKKGQDAKDEEVQDLVDYYTNIFNQYEWWIVHGMWEDDSYTVPFGGALELVWWPGIYGRDPWPAGLLRAFFHVDAGSMYINYDSGYPYVQLDPHDWNRAVAFKKREIARLGYDWITSMDRRGYQRSCVEKNWQNIEAMARLYRYDLKMLTDSPIPGILDLMDFSEADALEWSRGFSEMMLGVDPLKIPILYEHETPARFLPLGKPMDTKEKWKFYAERAGLPFGLSVGSLGIFEHDRTLAGARIQRITTQRTGVGGFAFTEAQAINTQFFPPNCPIEFQFDVPEIEDKLKLEQSRGTRIAYLGILVDKGALKPEDLLEQCLDDEILSIQAEPGLIRPGIQSLPAPPTVKREYPEYPEALQSEAARLAARVVMKSILIEDSPAFEDMQKTLEEQLLSKKKSDKRRKGIARVVQRVSRR